MKKVVSLLEVDVPTNFLGGNDIVILCGPVTPPTDEPWD